MTGPTEMLNLTVLNLKPVWSTGLKSQPALKIIFAYARSRKMLFHLRDMLPIAI